MPPDNATDNELAARARAGDRDAFGALVERYLRPALAVAWEFAPTRDDAEDLVQDAFHRALRALPSFDVGRPFRPWFFTILRNVGRNASERNARWTAVTLSDELEADTAPPDELVDRAHVRERVQRGLDILPPMQRACFRLCDIEQFDGNEVAQMLGVSVATVRTHRHRARAALREALGQLKEEREA